MALAAGTHLGHYEIRSPLGAGGMGEVYLAKDTTLDRLVALKVLPADVASKQERMRRFIQEAKAASALNHQNIITVYEISQSDSTHFIAMEFIKGVTLRQHTRVTQMNLGEVLEIAIQMASALAAAHEAGIVHRDIKPENVMIRPDGFVKVLDFGLVKLTEQQATMSDTEAPTRALVNTNAGTVMGTTQYMSPEQARGLAVDARTDIWSLGVMIYEMVAGCAPFGGETVTDVIASIVKTDPLPITRYAPDAPPKLEEIVLKALEKDREERYQVVKDLLIDLRRLKKRLEFEAELERSAPPVMRSGVAVTSNGEAGFKSAPAITAGLETNSKPAVRTEDAVAWPTSSAEYVIKEIRRHKLAVLIALLVVTAAAVGLTFYLHAKNMEAAIGSIAVLPLVNQNQDPDTEYLSDGLTESIINSLTQLQSLRVIARSSVFRYKGRGADPIAVGRELGVRAVLTGRIMQRGDNLSVSVELVDVGDNKQLWGEQYERKVSDLLAVQREIAQEITGNLRLKLSGADESRLAKRYTENPEAYQLYLKGRFYWNKRTGEAFKKAIEYFNQAIEKDPHYALAYAGLADVYVLLSRYSASTPQESYPKAKAAAKRALEIDDTLAEAHNALAGALFDYDWNFAESNREYQRAIELNPNYATVHHWYGSGPPLVMGRFDEAIAELKRAQELDPLSLIINADLGQTYISARRYDEAVEQLQKTLEMDQSFYIAHKSLGEAYALKGFLQDAITQYQKAIQLNDDPYVVALLGHAFAVSGKREEAFKTLDLLKEMAKRRYVSAYSFATVYAGLGERDQAFQWLEKSYQDRASDMAYFNVDPLLDNLRSDPRFQDLLRKVGLPR